MATSDRTGAVESGTAGSVDRHIGRRMKLRRKMCGLSQASLAERLGVTFQQVQKYEKGTNRIAAGRLYDVACLLGVSVGYFFEDLPPIEPGAAASLAAEDLTGLLTVDGSLRLLQAFAGLERVDIQRKLVELAEAMAGAAPPS